MKKNRVIIFTKIVGLNEYTRINRENIYAGSRLKKRITRQIMVECLLQRNDVGINYSGLYDLDVYWIVSNNKRDSDNVYVGMKFILDAIKQSGLLKDDNRRHIRNINHMIRTIPKKNFIIIRFKEVSNKKSNKL